MERLTGREPGVRGKVLGGVLLLCFLGRGVAGQQASGAAAGPAAQTGSGAGSLADRQTEHGAEATVTDEQRSAPTITGYDLQVHLAPAEAKSDMLARIAVRNDGRLPLERVVLQVSSTLRWESVSGREEGGAAAKLTFDQHRVDTDADHTGAATEAVIRLAKPLAPGAAVELAAFYSGTLEVSSGRLERVGAPAEQAALADWDGIANGEVLLRGFGQVLWYPVAAPQVFLGDGARFAQEVGEQRRRGSAAMAKLRLEVEYPAGQRPATAIFCGRTMAMTEVGEPAATDEAASPGIATAEFPASELGFGAPSLFVLREPAAGEGEAVTALSAAQGGAGQAGVEKVEAAARTERALLREWLGGLPVRQPVWIEHQGQPFAQGALLVDDANGASSAFGMPHLLSHAWFRSPYVWLDEGVAQFLPLVGIERERGRGAAMAQIEDQQHALQLAESNAGGGKGESLLHASSEVMYRNKAVAVLWMLRGLVGDDAIKAALTEMRSTPALERDPKGLEGSLERASKKDLAWFFADWVYADKGLPDLSIASAIARAGAGTGGRQDGALVAVEVRNDGDAAAEVPVTVRSGELTTTERLRVPGRGVASVRVLFQGTPEEVQVNDGTVPEAGESSHTVRLGAGR